MADEHNDRPERRQQARVGVVSSTAGHKTIRVVVENLVKHAKYGKFIRRRTKLAVHDANDEAQLGDVVEVLPCRRISKTKSWRLARVVRQAVQIGPLPGTELGPEASSAEPAAEVPGEVSAEAPAEAPAAPPPGNEE